MEQKNEIATLDEISSYLTSVMRGTATSDVLVTQGGEKICIKKTPDEKEKIKAAELLFKNFLSDKADNSNPAPVVLVDDFDYADE